MLRVLLLILFVSVVGSVYAQDSFSVVPQADSLGVTDSLEMLDSLVEKKAALILPQQKVRKITKTNNDPKSALIFFVGLAVFLLFGLLRFFYSKYINNLFNTLSRSTLWRLSANERLWQNKGDRILFMLIYFLSSGFLAGEIFQFFAKLELTLINSWLLGILFISVTYLFKYIVIQSVALVFRFTKMANYFFRHLLVVNQILGMLMLPIIGLVLILPSGLAPILILLSTFIFGMALIFKFLINVAYVRNLTRVNYIHFIVYLCTLELIPLAVLARYAYSIIGV